MIPSRLFERDIAIGRPRSCARVMVIFCTIVLGLCLMIAGCQSREDVAGDNQGKGNEVLSAIEAYHKAVGAYPPTIDTLVPQYLPAIPKLKKAEWTFRASGDGFSIGFSGYGSQYSGWYASDDPGWVIDSK